MPDDLQHRYIGAKIKTLPNGFEFKGKEFDQDGLRIVEYYHDAVSVIKPTLGDILQFIDATVKRVRRTHLESKTGTLKHYSDGDIIEVGNFDLSQISTQESLVRIGYEVEIVEGPSEGEVGIALALRENGNIVVSFSESNTTSEEEVPSDFVRIKYKVGDTVFVKFGAFAGRMGMVEGSNHRTLFVRESGTYEEVSNAKYIADNNNRKVCRCAQRKSSLSHTTTTDMRIRQYQRRTSRELLQR